MEKTKELSQDPLYSKKSYSTITRYTKCSSLEPGTFPFSKKPSYLMQSDAGETFVSWSRQVGLGRNTSPPSVLSYLCFVWKLNKISRFLFCLRTERDRDRTFGKNMQGLCTKIYLGFNHSSAPYQPHAYYKISLSFLIF